MTKGVLAMESTNRTALRRACAVVRCRLIAHRSTGRAEPPVAEQLLELHKDSLPPRLTVG